MAIIFSQVLGGAVGCIIAILTSHHVEDKIKGPVYFPALAKLCPQNLNPLDERCKTPIWAAEFKFFSYIFLAEMIGTAIFVSLIIHLKYIKAAKDDAVNAATVALTLFGMIQNIGSFTGGCLNPAVALTQGIFQNHIYGLKFDFLLCHLGSTFFGGVLAGLLGIANSFAHKKV